MLNSLLNKIFVIVIIILLFLLSLQRCNGDFLHTKIKTKTVVDTITKTVVDTIPFYNIKDSIRITNMKILDTIYSVDSSSIKYNTEVEDSLLSGNIFTTVLTDGTLVNQNFTYIPKFPKYIMRTDSIIINKNTTNTVQDWGIYGGTSIVPTNKFGMYGTIGFKTRKGVYIGAGYDPFNNNALIELKIKLNR
jgi:hypothetical protein